METSVALMFQKWINNVSNVLSVNVIGCNVCSFFFKKIKLCAYLKTVFAELKPYPLLHRLMSSYIINHDHHWGCQGVPGQRAEGQRASKEAPIMLSGCRSQRVRHMIVCKYPSVQMSVSKNSLYILTLQLTQDSIFFYFNLRSII